MSYPELPQHRLDEIDARAAAARSLPIATSPAPVERAHVLPWHAAYAQDVRELLTLLERTRAELADARTELHRQEELAARLIAAGIPLPQAEWGPPPVGEVLRHWLANFRPPEPEALFILPLPVPEVCPCCGAAVGSTHARWCPSIDAACQREGETAPPAAEQTQ